jgi:hypothetical protein
VAGCQPPSAAGQIVVKGDPVLIDNLYPPSEGPTTSQQFVLEEIYPERLWLTGVRAEVRNDEPGSTEGLLSALTVGFMDAERHRQLNAMTGPVSPSLFHLGDGLSSVKLPPGYGIATMSNELMHVSSVWQNRKLYRPPARAHSEVTLTFARQAQDSSRPALKPLRVFPLFATVPALNMADKGKGIGGPTTIRPVDPKSLSPDSQGRPASGRWWIPPGPSQVKSLVSYLLPAETELTVRSVTAFVYEDWTRLQLYDLTAQREVLAFEPRGASMQRDYPDGLAIDSRHRYELRVGYQNRSSSNHVGAGMVVLYADDPVSQSSP